MANDIEAVRAAFLAWIRDDGYLVPSAVTDIEWDDEGLPVYYTRDDGVRHYLDGEWHAWQAAMSRAALAVAPATAQPVRWIACPNGDHFDERASTFDDEREARRYAGDKNSDPVDGEEWDVMPLYAAPPATGDAAAVREACEKAEAMRPPGCAPEGNHASVEVVPTIMLDPLDVVWHEDGWHVVIDDAANDESTVTLAPIIDDSGGRDVEIEACAEFFLRCAPLPAPATAVVGSVSDQAPDEGSARVEEARKAFYEAARVAEEMREEAIMQHPLSPEERVALSEAREARTAAYRKMRAAEAAATHAAKGGAK